MNDEALKLRCLAPCQQFNCSLSALFKFLVPISILFLRLHSRISRALNHLRSAIMKVTAISLVDSAASDGVRQSTENPPARRPQVLVNAPNHLPTLSLDTNLEDSCIREAEERQTNTDLSSADNACGSSDDSTHFKHAESQSNQESGEWDYEGYDTDGCPHEAVEYLEGERIFVGSPDPDDPGYETPETALNSDAYVPALSDARWNIQLAKKASKMAPDPFLFISFHEHTAEATRFRPTIVDPGFNGQQQTVPLACFTRLLLRSY